MASINFMSWNMEWMNDLFTSDSKFHNDNDKPQHNPETTVGTRIAQLSKVIQEIAPDILVVLEGPNKTEELQLFFDKHVAGKWKTFIQNSPGQSQCVGIAVRTDQNKFAHEPFKTFDTLAIHEFEPFELDPSDEGIIEKYKFERSPLYIEITTADNKSFRVVGLHLKSKLVTGAFEWSRWWEKADANRRKIFAQASQIRQKFLDTYLTDAATKNIPLIVCGDINDGPGFDTSERKILGSGIERLMGSVWFPQLCMGNALFDGLKPVDQRNLSFDKIQTTSFPDPIFNGVYQHEWIDHILYSKNKTEWVKNAQVHIDMKDGKIWSAAYKHASDHYPVGVQIEL